MDLGSKLTIHLLISILPNLNSTSDSPSINQDRALPYQIQILTMSKVVVSWPIHHVLIMLLGIFSLSKDKTTPIKSGMRCPSKSARKKIIRNLITLQPLLITKAIVKKVTLPSFVPAWEKGIIFDRKMIITSAVRKKLLWSLDHRYCLWQKKSL